MADAASRSSPEPILDVVFLQALAEDLGADGAVEAARIFLEDAPARIPRMRQGGTVIRREAHALAGSARAVGLVRLGEAASLLQMATEATAADPASARRLEALLLQSMAALEVWLAAQPPFT